MKKNEITRKEAIEKLGKYLNPGDTVWTKLNHVSSSGMSRVIDVFIIRDNEPLRLTWSVADAIGATYDRKYEGVKMGGCGMDMGFEVVYNLGRAMFPDGFTCIGEGCRSNDHSNGDRNYEPHKHSDGGYAFIQRCL